MTTKLKPVSEAVAQFFLAECCGSESGKGYKFYNRSLAGICLAHGVGINKQEEGQKQFAEFCRAVADRLDPINEAARPAKVDKPDARLSDQQLDDVDRASRLITRIMEQAHDTGHKVLYDLAEHCLEEYKRLKRLKKMTAKQKEILEGLS